jgi:cytochrome c-type biogenesis protein CcmH/NrfG
MKRFRSEEKGSGPFLRKRVLTPFLMACVMALVAGCARQPERPQEPTPAPSPEAQQLPAPPPERLPPPRAETTAVAGLMDSARADTAAGRLPNAAATLERALRIEPRNARLWHELGQLRLRQRDYAQAESLAARSNTLAGSDADLRAANQRLIDDARARR